MKPIGKAGGLGRKPDEKSSGRPSKEILKRKHTAKTQKLDLEVSERKVHESRGKQQSQKSLQTQGTVFGEKLLRIQ